MVVEYSLIRRGRETPLSTSIAIHKRKKKKEKRGCQPSYRCHPEKGEGRKGVRFGAKESSEKKAFGGGGGG